jgi:hypothetical protein
MQHIIKKQILQFDVDNKLDVFATQQEMDQFNKGIILPLLEKIFDELTGERTILAIDKIEIDLGSFTIGDMKSINPAVLYEAILLQIRKSIRKDDWPMKNVSTGILKAVGAAAQWLFYMQHGYLPWNAIKINAEWHNEVLEAFAVEFDSVTALRQLITANEYARKRIIHQHEDKFLRQLIEVLTAEKQKDLLAFNEELTKIIWKAGEAQNKNRATGISKVQEKVWSLVLIGAAKKEKNLTGGRWARNILTTLIKDKQTAISIMSDLQDRLKLMLPLIVELISQKNFLSDQEPQGKDKDQQTPKQKTRKKRENTIEQRINDLQTGNDSTPKSDQTGNLINNRDKETKHEITEIENVISPEATKNKEPASRVDAEGIFIVNAGVVLLHPFLKQFFETTRLTEQKEFINNDTQQRALYLLHYLAAGNATPEEHELTIAKVLCAYDFAETVPKNIILSKAEFTEADQLLEAVISQWTILKSTSIAGLREGFLQRNGKLYRKNDNLYLQVEIGSIDMLLDYLPWNLSIIKLPWMKEMLRVEWR